MVVVLLAVVWSSRPVPLIASYVSPDGVHRLDLIGRADRPRIPVVTHTVYARVMTHGTPTVKS